ncbi:Hypothetical predicted protein [Drosophila guanche]|uniref:MD-2-related lipid-recognition domain-containing protein n=1 Tax=Drosophila guanche TaxID=7266 RepID=A0A3B0IYK5_DROGU|nr:Hypothetical predicted protein [Drosophila guanche]
MDCIPNPKFVENVTCYVKDLSWEKSLVQMDCHLIEPLRNPTVHIKLHKKDYTDQYKPFLVNISFKACDLIAGKSFIPYGLVMWRTLKKFTNANHTCPFVGHLFARDMVFEANNLPSSIPLGVYWVALTFLETYSGGIKETYGTVNWYWEIMRPKRKHKKNKTA